jgi:hypothetical protein
MAILKSGVSTKESKMFERWFTSDADHTLRAEHGRIFIKPFLEDERVLEFATYGTVLSDDEAEENQGLRTVLQFDRDAETELRALMWDRIEGCTGIHENNWYHMDTDTIVTLKWELT